MDKKRAFVFPGQGSQSVGMGFALATRFEDFGEIYGDRMDEADEALGFKLSDLMKTGPAEKLKETAYTQPALLTLSTAMAQWLRKNEIQADLLLGHSLGEYSALVHAGSLRFADAVKLVYKRGTLMSQSLAPGLGGMGALIGAGLEDAKALCAEAADSSEVLEPSVLNCAGQVVISGHQSAIKKAGQLCEKHGIRKLMPLEVSGPFHCSLLKEAGESLRFELEKVQLQKPDCPIVFNVTAETEFDTAQILENLVQQVYKCVLWSDSVHYAESELDAGEFIEVGSGKVLTGLIKKILPDAKCTPLESVQKLELLAA